MISAPAEPDGATWHEWGIDPTWSRLLDVPSHDGSIHQWHVLDTGPVAPTDADAPAATILCVHGNPTWGYAWKTFLTRFAGRHRVIAVDQLSMGYSDRVESRRYEDRIADLDDVVAALQIDRDMPLIIAAHDWGGAIAMGWAVDHPDRIAGMVLCNTGIGVPEGRGAPRIIRLAASEPLRDLVCRRTNGFVEGTIRLSGKRLTKIERAAFRSPYQEVEDRSAIADFVGDIPLHQTDPPHPTQAPLERVSSLLGNIEAPVLLAWGSKDIVFDDDFAEDLADRFPNATLQRFADANHLVMAEADVAGSVDTWLRTLLGPDVAPRPADDGATSSVFAGIERHREDADRIAVADLAARKTIDTASFACRVDGVAASLLERGLERGDRVAMLTPPGIDLLVAVYGVWRAGGVTVVADRGLGLDGLGRAVRSARPTWSIGPKAAGVASKMLRWAPRSTHVDVDELMGAADGGSDGELPPEPVAGDAAAVLFTSGATGPAKGVRYTHGQLAAQRDALARTYEIGDDDRLVAAFAPFSLYGPSLGVPTALTDCDVTTPGALTVEALDDACRVVDATMAFGSPAALANVVATAEAATADTWPGVAGLRLVFSAGAPVPAEILRSIAALAPSASIHTPYGMTEALPVSDIDLVGIEFAEAGYRIPGVCVGRPVDGAEIRICELGFDAVAGVPDDLATGTCGEILVRAPWVSEGYLGRWEAQRLARPGAGWHRTGDVGRVDKAGRLWIEGRSVHVIDTVDGPVTPVPIERAIERALSRTGEVIVGRVAAVGVGPERCEQLVIVLQSESSPGLASGDVAKAVREKVDLPVAAVLTMDQMPVDIRHNAKIDRSAVAAWARDVLAGDAPGTGVLGRISALRKS